MRERKVSFKGDIRHAFAMCKPETFHAWFQLLCPPQIHGLGLWPKICRRGRTGAFVDPQGRKNLFYPVYRASSFKWLRLKALTMISDKLHVFWRKTMSTGSIFFLCYKTPQQRDNQETMTSCILLVKYY